MHFSHSVLEEEDLSGLSAGKEAGLLWFVTSQISKNRKLVLVHYEAFISVIWKLKASTVQRLRMDF